jgi:hypothetical protein
MNNSKIQQLFAAARKEEAPEVPFQFDQTVVAAIRRDARRSFSPSLFEQLNQLFPRLAAAALIVIGLCVATDYYFSPAETNVTTTADVQQAAADWLFASN